ncbi:DUF6933 domain-containing protein [Pseudomonas fluorescens]|uniref:DUF6933 domain-containing protein n=1 Tax=Pseudomonas fluorescens TaxID=294 RepID=A0A944DVX6_PSEFL|nr:hypothetical protein [Pseudomonas fluorescens]MBT2296338.1 hypothetical protein [Pseudomonas fluorescens]MBT2308675.1 hypothetical protein [Pseudomonas fluorescens]MBT2312664.1 hypothetical protein [Pseudomonas fluorescens]MBT2317793.1 hypothetical protein [Pseudomonas fluorescens]MBT2328011.1 hypothetical protein [Pseudomonas fluorescens]
MLIFNCTEAASKFFSRVHKGKKITPVEAPPENNPTDDLPSEQWLVHAVTLQRKHVLFVLHFETRYCMVFSAADKADLQGFIHKFMRRWIDGVMQHAARTGVLEQIDFTSTFERLQAGESQYHFYRRGDRSVQGHLNEIVWMFTEQTMEMGLPADEIAANQCDRWLNGMLKGLKGQKDYIVPNEEMLMHWFKHYCGVSDTDVASARGRYKALMRESAAFE